MLRRCSAGTATRDATEQERPLQGYARVLLLAFEASHGAVLAEWPVGASPSSAPTAKT